MTRDWLSSWVETMRVAPPFSRRRRDLLARLADAANPDCWVDVCDCEDSWHRAGEPCTPDGAA